MFALRYRSIPISIIFRYVATRVPPRRDGGQGDLSIMTRRPMTLTMLGRPTPAARSMRSAHYHDIF